MGLTASLSNFKLTTSSGKHLQDISHAHIVSLVYKLITSAKGIDDLFIGFDTDRAMRRDEADLNDNIKGKCRLRLMLKRVFGFSECQEKATYGLCYKLPLT